jgi:tetratricopeptide (TPR) repeat protein
MYLLLGNLRMESGDYEGAIRSFERARAQIRPRTSRALLVVSLVSSLTAVLQRIEMTYELWQISGWKFDDLDITVRQRLSEALYAAGRIKDAGESLLNIVNTVDEDVYMTGAIITWVSGKSRYPIPPLCIPHFPPDFLQRCLSTPESSVGTTLNSPSPTPLLREWAQSKLTGGSWRDALVTALNVSIFFCSGALVGLTIRWSGVYRPEIHDLLHSLRPSRNDQPHDRCN